MSTQPATERPIDLLVDRILRNPSEHCDDRDIAFRLTILRRWVMRTGPALAEFHTDDGRHYALTRRGNAVALEELLARAGVCPQCEGEGRVTFLRSPPDPQTEDDARCPTCHGEGTA